MNYSHKEKLEQLGLSSAEAQIYLAVLRNGPLAAARIAHEAGIQRTSVYPTLCSLADKGLVAGGTGYGTKFTAVRPDEALRSLVAREKQKISEREQIAEELGEVLAPLAPDADAALDDTVQLIRTPHVISDYYQRLQFEADRIVETFVKGPILKWPNPAQTKAGRRGVQYKAIYERSIAEDPRLAPYLQEWIAGGEQIRVYGGELPYKLVLFDREVVLLTLVRRSGEPSAMVARHGPLARSLGLLFDHFWQQSQALALDARTARPKRKRVSKRGSASPGANTAVSRNGQQAKK